MDYRVNTVRFLFVLLTISGWSISAFAQVTGPKNTCADMNQPIVSVGSCKNDLIEFYAGRYPNTDYSWDFDGDGIYEYEALDTFATTYNYTSPGIYQASVKMVSPNCPQGAVQQLEKVVFNAPTSQFKLTQSCNEVKLKSFSGSVETTEWLLSDGSKYFGDEIDHAFGAPSGKFEVLLVTHIGGCSDTSLKVFEYQKAVAQPQLELSSQCIPSELTMSNGASGSNLSRWYINDSLVAVEAQAIHRLSKAGGYQISLAVSNDYGCTDSATLQNAAFLGPEVSADMAIERADLCLGTPLELEDKSVNSTHRTVLWGDGQTSENGDLNHKYDESGNYTVQLVAKNSRFNCTDTFTFQKEVTVHDLPVADFKISTEGVCVPQEVKFENLSGTQNVKATFLFNAYDTIDINQPLQVKKSGRHDFRLILENELAGCSSEKVLATEFFKPFSTRRAPSIFETETDSAALRMNWSSLPNTEYFELYQINGPDQEILGTTRDTFFTFPINDTSRSYGYAVKAVDQCAFQSGLSATVQGIDLKGSFQADSFPTLQWNPFEAWGQELDFYEVEVNIGFGWEPVGESEQPHFVDREFNKNDALKAQYRVIAYHKNGAYQSQSNAWTFEFEPNIFIPNAFTPNYDNINDVYKIEGYGMKKLMVKIFNAFGERVYSYEGQEVRWDGTFRDEIVPSGSYICVVEAETPNGQLYEFQRTISVLR